MTKEKEMISKLSSSEQIALIDEWIVGKHAKRNRRILKMYIVDGIGSYEKIGEKVHLSTTQVQKIVTRGCARICEHISDTKKN